MTPELRQLISDAATALEDWMNVTAPHLWSPERIQEATGRIAANGVIIAYMCWSGEQVEKSRNRIATQGGAFWYAARLRDRLREALEKDAK